MPSVSRIVVSKILLLAASDLLFLQQHCALSTVLAATFAMVMKSSRRLHFEPAIASALALADLYPLITSEQTCEALNPKL